LSGFLPLFANSFGFCQSAGNPIRCCFRAFAASGYDPGDPDVLAHAYRSAQVLITLDKDFGEIAIVRGQPHCGIVRLVALRAEEQGPGSVDVLARYVHDLSKGAIVTV
jgi:predicted nuclease of predicted toxin-antitoxin system